ncbi:MAG: hypothetical protein ACI9UK_000259 [Candidatus Krumholzibacteriia bacterium]
MVLNLELTTGLLAQREEENVNSRALTLILTLIVGLIALTGCSTENNEHQRLVVEADFVNFGAPLVVAGVNLNGTPGDASDDFVPIEFLTYTFSARALNDNMVIPENGTYSTFNITHYDLVWVPSSSAPAALTDYNITRGGFTLSVPINNEVESAILVSDIGMKAEPWFPGVSFVANADVTFYGHESSSEHEVAIRSSVTVQFIAAVSQ